MEFITPYIVPILQIIWIDLLLSGDNAVVIALACRQLPERQRKLGMLLGAAHGIEAIPKSWREGLLARPLLERLSHDEVVLAVLGAREAITRYFQGGWT